MNVLSPEKKALILAGLAAGMSDRAIERTTGIHRETIGKYRREQEGIGKETTLILNAVHAGAIRTEEVQRATGLPRSVIIFLAEALTKRGLLSALNGRPWFVPADPTAYVGSVEPPGPRRTKWELIEQARREVAEAKERAAAELRARTEADELARVAAAEEERRLIESALRRTADRRIPVAACFLGVDDKWLRRRIRHLEIMGPVVSPCAHLKGAERYAAALKLGLCVSCAKWSALPGITRCAVCKRNARTYQRRKAGRRREAGLCFQCRAPSGDRFRCGTCRAKRGTETQ